MREKDNILLDSKQVKVLMLGIEKVKDEDPSFNDETCNVFEDYVYRRAMELAFDKSKKNKIFKNKRKYEISKNMFKYISYITGDNVLDPDYVDEVLKNYNTLKKGNKVGKSHH